MITHTKSEAMTMTMVQLRHTDSSLQVEPLLVHGAMTMRFMDLERSNNGHLTDATNYTTFQKKMLEIGPTY